MATADGKTPFYKKWWFWLIIVVVIIGAAGAGGSQKTGNMNKTEDEVISDESTANPVTTPKPIDKDVIENECTDAKYGINKDGFSPIYISDYNFQTYDYAYTEDGDTITLAEWNGKHNGEKVIFHCYISGKDSDNLDVYWISADGVDLWKDEATLNSASYNKDGNPIHKSEPQENPAPQPSSNDSVSATKAATTSTPVTQTKAAENPNLPLKATCEDGTVQYQDDPAGQNYRGMCSSHGGIAQKHGRVP